MPPTGRTRPRSVISPVIARSPRTGRPVSSDASAVTIVTPADGPSFGMAPAGTCRWISASRKKSPATPSSSAFARTHESAACADSFITSPSWPVSVSVPLPGIREASTKRTSPPVGVHARPMATPGFFVRSSTSSSRNLGAPSSSTTSAGVTVTGCSWPSARRARHLPAERGDLALEVPHARLARVAADHGAQRVVGEGDVLGGQAVVLHLLRHEVLAAILSFSSSV